MKTKIDNTGFAIEITDSDKEFMSKISKHNLFGMLGDQIASWRFENAVKIFRRTEKFAKDNKVSISLVPSKFLQQFIEASSLEEDDSLQDMWANLLINKSIDANSVNILYVDILKSLEPIEAVFIQMIFMEANNSTDTTFDLKRVLNIISLNETELRILIYKMYGFNVLRPPLFKGMTMGNVGHNPAIETTDLFRFSDLGLDFCKKCGVGS